MDVASGLFLELGYDGVSMQDIADNAQLTKGGVYRHFQSKGQLLVEVIRWMIAKRENSAPFREAMQAPETALGTLFDEEGRAMRLLLVDAATAARHHPDVAAGMADWANERLAAIRDALVDVVSDPQTVSWLVAAMSMGVGMMESIAIGPPALDRTYSSLRGIVDGARP